MAALPPPAAAPGPPPGWCLPPNGGASAPAAPGPPAAAAPPPAVQGFLGAFGADAAPAGAPADEDKLRPVFGRVARRAIILGFLGAVDELQVVWEGEGDMPFDPTTTNGQGKPIETLDSFLNEEKGHFVPVTMSAAVAAIGVACLDSLVRVVTALPPGLEFQEHAMQMVEGSIRVGGDVTEADKDIVIHMFRLFHSKHMANKQLGRAYRYGSVDTQVLTALKKSGAAPRLEAWGQQVAQVFVDFCRHIGETLALYSWEKKTGLSEAFLVSTLRSLVHITMFPVSEEMVARTRRFVAPPAAK